MNKFFPALLILASALGFTSCSNELDVAAPYKEIPVVYGLLNQKDSIHYIKINKAFLNTEGSALVAASVPDSTYFPYNLDVSLDEYNLTTGQIVRHIVLDTVSVPKEPGTFGGPNSLLYRTPAGTQLNTNVNLNYEYRLNVLKRSDQSVLVKSACKIVYDFGYYTPVFECIFVNNAGRYQEQDIVWASARNGRMYDLFMRFQFMEINYVSHDTVRKYIDMPLLKSFQTSTLAGNERINVVIDGELFYRTIQDELDPLDPNTYIRKINGNIEFHFSVAGDDLAKYIQFNGTNTSLNDIKPEFTNIQNGIGVFSARYNKMFNNTPLNFASQEELINGPITGDLNFQ